MNKRMRAISNLIHALMDAHSDMTDIITSKPPSLFTEEEHRKMLVNELFIYQAFQDVKEEAKDIIGRGDKNE